MKILYQLFVSLENIEISDRLKRKAQNDIELIIERNINWEVFSRGLIVQLTPGKGYETLEELVIAKTALEEYLKEVKGGTLLFPQEF